MTHLRQGYGGQVRPWVVGGTGALLLLGAAAVSWSRVVPDANRIPTAALQSGSVTVRVHATGDLRATKSVQMFVPPMGGQLTIVSLANSGTAVKTGDVIAEFDASEPEFALEQATFELQLADQEIAKAEAEAAVLEADDEVQLLTARFNVRRAELDAKANELIGTLVAQQNGMLLEEARARLAAVEKDVQSHRDTSKASTSMIRQRRTKAQVAVAVAKRNIDSLLMRAPFDGIVSIRQNFNAYGGIVFGGTTMPDFRPGDAAGGGTLLAELIDTSRVEVTAKLAEQDRANVAPGQTVDIRVDATPDLTLTGTVRSVSSVASRQMFEAAGDRKFDIAFDVTGNADRVRPGVSAALAISGQVFEQALHVPRAAIFDVTGQPTVYVRGANGFEPKAIKVRARTETLAIIEGLTLPADVALVNPSRAASARTAGAPMTTAPQRLNGRLTADVLLPDLGRSLDNLLLHKLRTLLTMLGMIFGVAAVLSMLSIGAGAQQQVMAFIEGLGVRNVIVEARETLERQAYQKVRLQSPGLTFQDMRAIQAAVPGIDALTPRKRFTPTQMVPKPAAEMPVVYGVEPVYQDIASLRLTAGRFFTDDESARAAALCVLGEAARIALFGVADPMGQFVKIGEHWFRVIGIAGPQATAREGVGGAPAQDRNNLIYVPTAAAILRLEDGYSMLRDEIDGLYLRFTPEADISSAAAVMRGVLEASHRNASDYSIIVPAELLAEQQRTKRVFDIVMVALASISLLVGGIGIMNIMLASVLERTPEIGLRRALGATRVDVIRQFVLETTLLAVGGGMLGLVLGLALSQAIASFAGWSTVVTGASLLLAFLVSVIVGLVSGIYPAMKASKLDPIQALRYE